MTTPFPGASGSSTGNQMSLFPSAQGAQYPQQESATNVMAGTPAADTQAAFSGAGPGESTYKSPDPSLEGILPVLRRAYMQLTAAREGYERAEKYYRGVSPEVFSDPQLRRLLGLSEDVFALNYAAVPITVVANRMNLATLEVPGNATASNAITAIWKWNKMPTIEHGFMVDTLKYGDNYMIVWPVDGPKGRNIEIQPNNPLTTRVFYDPEDMRTKIYAIKSWVDDTGLGNINGNNANAATIRIDMYFPDYVAKFYSSNQGKDWQEYNDGSGQWPTPNPFGTVPVFHFRAGDTVPYGTPEHAAAYGPQDGLVKTANTLFAVLDFLGFPQRYALTELTDASGTAEFSDFDENQPDAFITDQVGRTSGMRQGPGELWALRAKEVGQFNAAPVTNFISTWDQCVTAMSACTATPMRFFIDPAGQHPSGDALRAADIPLKQKVGTRQLQVAAAWEDLLIFALSLLEIAIDDVKITWKPSDISDDLQAMQGAVWKLRTGVPAIEVYKDLGYAPEEIATWGLKPEASKAGDPQLWASAAAVLAPTEVGDPAVVPPGTPGGPPAADPMAPGAESPPADNSGGGSSGNQ